MFHNISQVIAFIRQLRNISFTTSVEIVPADLPVENSLHYMQTMPWFINYSQINNTDLMFASRESVQVRCEPGETSVCGGCGGGAGGGSFYGFWNQTHSVVRIIAVIYDLISFISFISLCLSVHVWMVLFPPVWMNWNYPGMPRLNHPVACNGIIVRNKQTHGAPPKSERFQLVCQYFCTALGYTVSLQADVTVCLWKNELIPNLHLPLPLFTQ